MSEAQPGLGRPCELDVRRVAHKLCETYGSDAVLIARRWADIAAQAGDDKRAAAWRRIMCEVAEPKNGKPVAQSPNGRAVAESVESEIRGPQSVPGAE